MLNSFKSFFRRYRNIFSFIRALKYAGESSPLVYNCRSFTANNFIRTLIQIIVTPYCMLRYFFPRKYSGREGLAFVLIAKNEAPYITEWLDFHIKQGVSHFIIYDNESTDNLREVLRPYIESGTVIYSIITGKIRQLDAYNMALHDYGHKFKYMGFIDADEFVFIRNITDEGGGACQLIQIR